MGWYKEENNSLIVYVHVIPKSSKSELIGLHNGLLKIKLKAQPVDNEANKELIKLFAKILKIPKSSVEIISGYNQKKKTLEIKNGDLNKLQSILG